MHCWCGGWLLHILVWQMGFYTSLMCRWALYIADVADGFYTSLMWQVGFVHHWCGRWVLHITDVADELCTVFLWALWNSGSVLTSRKRVARMVTCCIQLMVLAPLFFSKPWVAPAWLAGLWYKPSINNCFSPVLNTGVDLRSQCSSHWCGKKNIASWVDDVFWITTNNYDAIETFPYFTHYLTNACIICILHGAFELSFFLLCYWNFCC